MRRRTHPAGEPPRSQPLDVPRPRWVAVGWVLAALSLVAVAGWYTTHPRLLTTSELTLTASTPSDQAVYVGVLSRVEAGHRSIQVRDVQVDLAQPEATVDAAICRRGRIAVTTSPEAFCSDIAEAVGNTVDFTAGDQLILRISSAEAGTFTIDGVQLAFREGLQWDTQHAGPTVEVTILAR